MEHKHLDAAALDHLLAEDRTAKQNEQLFHLLAVCPHCYEVGGWLLELHRAHALPPIFGPLDAALARSRADAPQLVEEILPLDPEERLARLHADPRLVSWGFCELLVQRSSRTASEPARAATPPPRPGRTPRPSPRSPAPRELGLLRAPRPEELPNRVGASRRSHPPRRPGRPRSRQDFGKQPPRGELGLPTPEPRLGCSRERAPGER